MDVSKHDSSSAGTSYHESYRPWWNGLIILFCVFMIGLVAFVFWQGMQAQENADKNAGETMQEAWVTFAIVVPTFILLASIGWVFGRYTINVDESVIEFGYRGFKKRFVRDEIKSKQTTNAEFREFLGWGWRIGIGKRIGYIARMGPSVEVVDQQGRTYVFSCADPDSCLRAMI